MMTMMMMMTMSCFITEAVGGVVVVKQVRVVGNRVCFPGRNCSCIMGTTRVEALESIDRSTQVQLREQHYSRDSGLSDRGDGEAVATICGKGIGNLPWPYGHVRRERA